MSEQDLDQEFDAVTELAETDTREHLKSRWARVEAIVGAEKRIAEVAQDLVQHSEKRYSVEIGKGLIVCMSRRICVDLYDEIEKLRPEWHSDNDDEGQVQGRRHRLGV